MKISKEIIDMDYINSTPAADGFRMPAEFERHQGVHYDMARKTGVLGLWSKGG